MTLPTSRDPRTNSLESRPDGEPGRRRKSLVLLSAVPIAALAAIAIIAFRSGDGSKWQTGAIGVQGASDVAMTDDGARLQRRADGILIEVAVPTPTSGTYEYPTSDMIPPWAEPHPSISPGSGRAPEVFTLWLFAFNESSLCTNAQCDLDDLASGAAARGGSYQLDGRVGEGTELSFSANVRLGQPPMSGVPLDDPLNAEIHVAIAPHGRFHSGEDGWRQLNGPVGNPTLWWAASFDAP